MRVAGVAGAKRRVRAVATLAVAAIVMVGLLAGCGNGSSKPDLAAQDKAVQRSNRLAAVRAQYVAAQRRLAQARREIARVRSKGVAVRRAAPRTIVQVRNPVLPSIDLSRGTFCTPPGLRAANGAQRRALRAIAQRRRRALYYLNLSCPAA